MLSFIIIGRNEGWKLNKCIESVVKTIEFSELSNAEIIYVDSDSNDGSVEIAKGYKQVKIYKIKGDINAAIARNVGRNNAKGDVLFFIDGDMEIQPEFLNLVYSKKNGLIHDFVSGNWINYYYNFSDELLRKDKYKEMKTDAYEKVTGGFFLINKDSWDMVGGMDNRFKKSQDIDLGLQLAKQNILLLRKKEVGVKHHTIDYLDKKRMWKDFLDMNHLYGRSFLYRNHLLNGHMYHRLLRLDYTMILLLLSILSLPFYQPVAIVLFSIYLLALIIRGKLNLRNTIYFFLRDLTVLFGLFMFYPKKNKFLIEEMN